MLKRYTFRTTYIVEAFNEAEAMNNVLTVVSQHSLIST